MKSIELFAGAGGLGMGLHAAGFEPVNVIEWDRYCCDTIRENQSCGVEAVRGWNLTAGDVRHVDFEKYEGKVRLVSGGPPCQPFSLGGKHKAHRDRRDMFPEAIRAVREAKPEAFIFENVKGLTRASFRSISNISNSSLNILKSPARTASLGPPILRGWNSIIRAVAGPA